MEALDWLVQDVAEGDVVLFTFSGHGCLPDDVGHDDHKLDEAICPVDWDHFDWGLVPYRLITDDLLQHRFAKLPSGALLTVVIDASVAGSFLQLPLRIDLE